MMPRLEEPEFVRAGSGLRPHTPDEMPIIDRLPDLENVWLAAGHFTKGVLLAPVTGRLVAEWVVSERPSIEIPYLRWNRFRGGQR